MLPSLTPQTLAQQSQPKKRNITIFLLCLFVSVALAIFLTYPKYSDYTQAKQTLAAEQASLSSVQDDQKKIDAILPTLNGSDFSKVQIAIPSTAVPTDIYADMENLTKAANVKLTSVQAVIDDTSAAAPDAAAATSADGIPVAPPTVTVPPVPSSLGTISISVDVGGTYSQIQNFMKSVYSSLRIITIQELSITTGTGPNTANGSAAGSPVVSGSAAAASAADPQLDAKISMQAYYAK